MEPYLANSVPSPPAVHPLAEESMLREDVVREVLARLTRGEKIKTIARTFGIDRKTIKRWRRLGRWQPRQGPRRLRRIDPFLSFLEQRAPEVGWNGVVLHRELESLGFTGTVQQVRRAGAQRCQEPLSCP